MIIGMFFSAEVLTLFGAKGAILEPAREFYFPVLATIPFLALCMMGNNVMIKIKDIYNHSNPAFFQEFFPISTGIVE